MIHPGGKKFMSLILDLIQVAMKEIMRRRKLSAGKAFDMDKVLNTVSNMKEVETDLVKSIKQETLVIKEKSCVIQELIECKIYPAGKYPFTFVEFIEAWNDHNKNRFSEIAKRNGEIDNVYQRTADLFERANQMLSSKNFEVDAPPLSVIKEIAEFYDNAGVADESLPNPVVENKVNFTWLIIQLHLVLPTIISYVNNFTIESPESSIEEMKILQRLSVDVSKIESNIEKFGGKWRKMAREVIPKLKKEKGERDRLEEINESPEELAVKAAKEQVELDNLKILQSPKLYFDVSKNCLKHIVVKKNRLALMDDAGEGKENLANETKLFRPMKSPYVSGKNSRMNQSKLHEMVPPKQQPRKRLNPMEMLERAMSNDAPKSRRDLNSSSRYTGTIPKFTRSSTPGLSSTMILPDRTQLLFNCSTISEIMKSSPSLPPTPDAMKAIDEENSPWSTVVDRGREANVKSTGTDSPWPDIMKHIQKSPKGGLTSLVSTKCSREIAPKINLNDNPLQSNSIPDNFANATNQESEESTIKNNNEKSSDNFSFASFQLPNDENLFNISDTILNGIDDDWKIIFFRRLWRFMVNEMVIKSE